MRVEEPSLAEDLAANRHQLPLPPSHQALVSGFVLLFPLQDPICAFMSVTTLGFSLQIFSVQPNWPACKGIY